MLAGNASHHPASTAAKVLPGVPGADEIEEAELVKGGIACGAGEVFVGEGGFEVGNGLVGGG